MNNCVALRLILFSIHSKPNEPFELEILSFDSFDDYCSYFQLMVNDGQWLFPGDARYLANVKSCVTPTQNRFPHAFVRL